MEILDYFNLVWGVGPGLYGSWVRPMVYGMAVGELFKRGFKFKGINNPMIPWGTSIAGAAFFAYFQYNPAITGEGIVSFISSVAVLTPISHTIILTALASNQYTMPFAKAMAGKTKQQIDPDSITITEEVDPETDLTMVVVRGDTEDEDDKTIMRKVKKKLKKVIDPEATQPKKD